MDLLVLWDRQKHLFPGQKSPIYRDLSIQGFAPKRNAARSNRAGDAIKVRYWKHRDGFLYHKEFNMDCERFDGNHISLDALLEEVDDYDKHNTVPSSFISKSAEQDYFDNLESSDENTIPEKIAPEFSQLDEQEKQLLLTYRNRESVVKQVSIHGKHTSKRTTQRRRKEIADKVRIAYEERVKINE